MENKTRTIGIRLSETEYAEIGAICDDMHISKSSFIRFATFNTLTQINKEKMHHE